MIFPKKIAANYHNEAEVGEALAEDFLIGFANREEVSSPPRSSLTNRGCESSYSIT